jgi:hypothetical protein
MQRIKSSTAVSAKPAYVETGTPGYFTEGDAVAGTPATVVTQDFLNMVQEELRNLVVAGGLTPSATDDTQLRQAVLALIAAHDASAAAHADIRAMIDALALGHGQCRLIKSAANVVLEPHNGNRIIIGGVVRTIPSAGVSLAPTGLTAGTLYYIYAYMVGDAMTLEASTTGHSIDATTGVEIKSGDSTRTLVGMVRPIAGPAFVDTDAQRFVLSWHSRRNIAAFNSLASASTTSSAYVELTPSNRAEFLSWADETLTACISMWLSDSTGYNSYGQLFLDGSLIMASPVVGINSGAGSLTVGQGMVGVSAVSDGYHNVTVKGCVTSGGTATYAAIQLTAMTRG